MKFIIQIFCWLALALLPSVVAAQVWGPVAAQYGPGFGICTNSAGAQNCLILRCDAEDGLQFNFVGPAVTAQRTTGIMRVDAGKPETISWRASGRPSELQYNHAAFDHGDLL
ncbi:MAG: hypothetical protein ACSHWS_15970, partial [Sulfitobacter sp.]